MARRRRRLGFVAALATTIFFASGPAAAQDDSTPEPLAIDEITAEVVDGRLVVRVDFAEPVPPETTTGDGQVFPVTVLVELHAEGDCVRIAQADLFAVDGFAFPTTLATGDCPDGAGTFPIEAELDDDLRGATLRIGPVPGIEDLSAVALRGVTLVKGPGPPGIAALPAGGATFPVEQGSASAATDAASTPSPTGEGSAESTAVATAVPTGGPSDPSEPAAGQTADPPSQSAADGSADGESDDSDGGNGVLIAVVVVVAVLVVGGGAFAFRRRGAPPADDCAEELEQLQQARGRAEAARERLAEAETSLAGAESTLAGHEAADGTAEGRDRPGHFQRLTEARQVRDRAREAVAEAEAELRAREQLVDDARYTYDVCTGRVEPRGGGISEVPETPSSRPTTVVGATPPQPPATTEPEPSETAPRPAPVPATGVPEPDGDDPRDTPVPGGGCTPDQSPRFERFGAPLKGVLDLDYTLTTDDTGLRRIEEADQVAGDLDDIAEILEAVGDATDAAADALGALGVTPSVPAARFGNALDTARAVLQTTAELSAAAARFAGAVNRRNSMYAITGELHHYEVELQWVERWECRDDAWVCAGFELHRVTFTRSATTSLDEDRETFPPTRSGMRQLQRRFAQRQHQWDKKVRDDQTRLRDYLDTPKTGPCAGR